MKNLSQVIRSPSQDLSQESLPLGFNSLCSLSRILYTFDTRFVEHKVGNIKVHNF
jgi:hypothetical protein